MGIVMARGGLGVLGVARRGEIGQLQGVSFRARHHSARDIALPPLHCWGRLKQEPAVSSGGTAGPGARLPLSHWPLSGVLRPYNPDRER